MKNVLKIGALALAMFTFAFSAQAQQTFGYVDAQAILTELPAVKQAEANLEALQAQLQKKLEASITQFQTDVQAFQQKVERGELSRIQQEDQQAALEKRQQELAGEEQKMVQQIQDKRTELLEPIYDSLNEAIAAVAKENGFTFIFDKQVLLYSEESQDVSEAVKAKINI
ncbi:OmpH family outer membrane protein [Lewinella sp. LCG006]|uniref:OmpH family outer membrane protein n=1 Tax=Lewinella sp. LCG006 TaxID=3231911 RepID=UPI00345F9A6F